MIEIAGLAISGLGLISDLGANHRDLIEWQEDDIWVDDDWLQLAIEKGQLPGPFEDYIWSAERHIPSRELKDVARVVIAYNNYKRLKYRIWRGV